VAVRADVGEPAEVERLYCYLLFPLPF